MADPGAAGLVAQGALLAALLDQSCECIKLLDATGKILFVNREGCRAMELSTPDAVVGQAWIERWPADARPVLEDGLGIARAGGVARFRAARPGPSGKERWWDVTVTPVAGDGGARFLTIARDATAEVAERQRVDAIGAEMRHRLRNAMTIAAGIVTLAARAQPAHRAFAQEVGERLGHLATVQDILLDPTREKRFSEIIPLLASAYGGGTSFRVGSLPHARLDDGATQALALAFGELATNSLKYGALGQGQPVDIFGTIEGGMLEISWRESTSFGPPRDGGQGLKLIDRLVTAGGGRIDREVHADLLSVRIALPATPSA